MVVAAALGASAAHAQSRGSPDGASDEGRRQEARRHFDRGVAFAGQTLWNDAIHELEAARDIRATASVSFNLGIAYRAVGRRRDAILAFRAFLATTDASDASRRAEVETLLAELASSLAHLTLHVEPATALVTIDGAPLPDGATLANGTTAQDLDPGSHVVSASADGYRTVMRTAVFTSGRATEISLRLIPATRVSRLIIDTNVRQAVIRIDDQVAAPGSADEFIEAGHHQIVASAPGRRSAHRDVSIDAGQTMRVQLDLPPERSIFESPWFWVGTGGVVLATIVTSVVLATTPQPLSGLGYQACVGTGCPR